MVYFSDKQRAMLPENWRTSMNNDEIYHYGVKGMKWGIRKKPQTSTKTSTKTLRKNASASKMLSNKKTKRYVNNAGDVRSRGGMALDRLGNDFLIEVGRKATIGILNLAGASSLKNIVNKTAIGMHLLNASNGIYEQLDYRDALFNNQKNQ